MTTEHPASGHISTLTMHQLRYGELDRDQERALRAHLDACPRCRERLNGQEFLRHAFELQPVPPAIRAAGQRSRGGAALDRLLAWLGGHRWSIPALAAAALALAVVIPRLDAPSDGTRTKGAEEVVVLLEGHGALGPEDAVHPGDRVQLEITGPWMHAWMTDGAAIIDDFDLAPGGTTLAPFSLTVDDAPGNETIVLVLSQRALNGRQLSRVLAAAERGSEPGLPGVLVKRLELRKEAHR